MELGSQAWCPCRTVCESAAAVPFPMACYGQHVHLKVRLDFPHTPGRTMTPCDSTATLAAFSLTFTTYDTFYRQKPVSTRERCLVELVSMCLLVTCGRVGCAGPAQRSPPAWLVLPARSIFGDISKCTAQMGNSKLLISHCCGHLW